VQQKDEEVTIAVGFITSYLYKNEIFQP